MEGEKEMSEKEDKEEGGVMEKERVREEGME